MLRVAIPLQYVVEVQKVKTTVIRSSIGESMPGEVDKKMEHLMKVSLLYSIPRNEGLILH